MTPLTEIIPHIEALIFASDKPLTTLEITDLINQAFGFMEDKISPDQVDAALLGITEKYNSEFYPFEVRQSGGGWQFLTKKDFHKTVAQLNGEKFLKRLSSASLETLAIIAYKQPITKGEIEAIRGVSSDYSVQKLLEKELIIISGRNEKLPGHPLVYATSKYFMDYFGINSPEDLPKIREVLAEQVVEPTVIHHTDFEQSDLLSISNDGELILKDVEEGEDKHVNGHAHDQLDGNDNDNEHPSDIVEGSLDDINPDADNITEDVTPDEGFDDETGNDTTDITSNNIEDSESENDEINSDSDDTGNEEDDTNKDSENFPTDKPTED